MRNLIKADLKRAWKDKLILVLFIVGGVFALTTPLLYKGIALLMNMEEMMEIEGLLGSQFNAKTLFFTSFSPSNNFGMILPIMVAIILCKDFGQGTVRNKIICGKSRTKIYFSLFSTCAILMCGFILAQAIVTLLVSLVLFDYQATPFTAKDFGYLLASVGFEMIVYLFISALLMFFVVAMKNAGTAVVMYFVVNFFFLIVGSITQSIFMFADPTTSSYKVLEVVNNANMFTSLLIGGGVSYTAKEVLSILIPNILLGGLLVFLGLRIFKKKDLK